MEIIDMTRDQFNNLEKLVLPNGMYNTETHVYRFSYHDIDVILKKISDSDSFLYSNKLGTIQLLDKYTSYMPNSFIIPMFLVSINKCIQYFAIPYINGNNLSEILTDDKVSYSDKKYYLMKIGQILEQMKALRNSNESLRNFYLGDLHEDNFIVDLRQGEIYVIDLDDAKTSSEFSPIAKYLSHVTLLNYVNDKYSVDIENAFFTSYKVDENTELFCYIIIILNFLYGDNVNNMNINEYHKYLNYLECLNININLLNCFRMIVSSGDNINPMSYIQTLTSEQILRAKKKVYMLKNN